MWVSREKWERTLERLSEVEAKVFMLQRENGLHLTQRPYIEMVNGVSRPDCTVQQMVYRLAQHLGATVEPATHLSIVFKEPK